MRAIHAPRARCARAGDRRLLPRRHHRGGPCGRRRRAAAAPSPGAGRMRAGRLQAGLRAGVRLRDPRGWRRAARRAATFRASSSGSRNSGCEMVIGSRFVAATGPTTALARSLGIRFFRLVLRPILGRPVHDPTSGFVGVNRSALAVFSRSFPAGVSRDRSAGGAAAQALPLRGGALQDAAAHHGRARPSRPSNRSTTLSTCCSACSSMF